MQLVFLLAILTIPALHGWFDGSDFELSYKNGRAMISYLTPKFCSDNVIIF